LCAINSPTNGRRRHPSANHGTDPLDLQLSFIPGLSHLTSLALPGLNLSLESVPDLAALTALQRLELQGNALRSLPDSFLQQQSLLTYGVHADVLLQLQQLGMCTAFVEDTMLSRLLTQAQQQRNTVSLTLPVCYGTPYVSTRCQQPHVCRAPVDAGI
jgi:hypothetical protein